MMIPGKRGLVATTVLLMSALAASAQSNVSIQYNLVSLGGNTYEYIYSVTNNGPVSSPAVQLFDIDFPTNLYGSLSIVTPAPLNTLWTQQILTGPPGPPALYDVLRLSGGISPGATVTGFAVQFTWLGIGLPGSQAFQIYNPNTLPFTLTQNGNTVSSSGSLSVPAASTVSLMLAGLGLALASAYQARARAVGRITTGAN
jgi:hypothetical protein